VRERGQRHGELHGGGPRQIDPIFGYRTQNGKIHAGMVRVIFELSEIHQGDGGTHFLAGAIDTPRFGATYCWQVDRQQSSSSMMSVIRLSLIATSLPGDVFDSGLCVCVPHV
jgi:hypothetical protein